MTAEAEAPGDGPDIAPGVRRAGLLLGPALAAGLLLIGAPAGLSPEAWVVAALGLWMATWWVTEAVPLPVTSLLPLIVLPLGAGLKPVEAAAQYANPVLLLFLGGFLLSIAVERWGLSQRIAYQIVARAGPRPRMIVAGFMLATAFVSMWISNTATSMMMTPLALGVAAAAAGGRKEDPVFAMALILGVCHASTIGGVGTPIGSPTNLIAVSWLEEQGIEVSFAAWMAIGVPVMLALLPTSWLLVTRGLRMDRAAGEAAQGEVRAALTRLGPVSPAEFRTGIVFLCTALLWVSSQWLTELPGLAGLEDMTIAIIGAVALFLIPAGAGQARMLLTWKDAEKVPWGIILLFGGGLALADAATDTGLAAYLGQSLSGLAGLPTIALVLIVVAVLILITEFASNVASISMMLPILGGLIAITGASPAALVVPAAIAASTGFMMPVGTAPNAIAVGTGKVAPSTMIRLGVTLNVVSIVVLGLVGLYIAPRVLG